jgi:hypothetical protein
MQFSAKIASVIISLILLDACKLRSLVSESKANDVNIPRDINEQIRILVALKDQLPSIFVSASTYDVNFFKIFAEQQELLEELRANQEYTQGMRQRHNTLYGADIGVITDRIIIERSIDRVAISTWSKDLQEMVEEVRGDISKLAKELSSILQDGLVSKLDGITSGIMKTFDSGR